MCRSLSGKIETRNHGRRDTSAGIQPRSGWQTLVGALWSPDALVSADEPVRRTSEIEEVSNLYFIHPIAARLTRLFAKLRLTPNTVSLTGMLSGLLAALAYYHYQNLQCAIAGFVLMIVWHIMDGADGQLARLTQSQSHSGKIIDGICDYVTFIAVYVALALALSQTLGPWIWLLIVVAGACHAAQAAAYEVQRQEYNFWGWDQKSAELPDVGQPLRRAGLSATQRLLDRLYNAYVRLQYRAAGVTPQSRGTLALHLRQQPQQASAIRRKYRATFAPTVRRWSLLSANYRTLGIFIAAALKAPEYYFWFEVFGFSAIMLLLIRHQRRRYQAFLDELCSMGAMPSPSPAICTHA